MGQIAEQITAEETANIQAQKDQLDAQVQVNVLTRLQAALAAAREKVTELEADVAARTPQTPEQPLDENGNPIPAPEVQG